MQQKGSPSGGGTELAIADTDKPVSGWGGLVSVFRFVDRLGLRVPGYTFHTVVTTLELSAVEVWRFYNSRGECENRIKELKEDFGAGGVCLHSFYGTEAVFRLICCLYNRMAEFRRDILRAPGQRLLTIRHEVLVVGGILGAHGRQVVLRLGLRGQWRDRFAALLSRTAAYTIPTVAQFDLCTLTRELGPPRRWSPIAGKCRLGSAVWYKSYTPCQPGRRKVAAPEGRHPLARGEAPGCHRGCTISSAAPRLAGQPRSAQDAGARAP